MVKLENTRTGDQMVIGKSMQVSTRPETQTRLSPASTSKALQGAPASLTNAYPARASK